MRLWLARFGLEHGCETGVRAGLAEQLGGGWPPSRGQIGAWLKRHAVIHVTCRDVFVYLSSAGKIVGPSDAHAQRAEIEPNHAQHQFSTSCAAQKRSLHQKKEL